MRKEVIKFFEELEMEMKLRRFSKRTISTYLYQNQKFMEFLKHTKTGAEFQKSLISKGSERTPQDVTNKDIRAYIAYLNSEKDMASSTVNLAISALRFFYVEVLEKDIFQKVKSFTRDKKLPVVLSKEEIKRMIDQTKNKKHRLLIEFLYSSGCRVNETVNVRKRDLNFDEKVVFIKYGKGKKERMVNLSKGLMRRLQRYINTKKSQGDYVFQYRGKPITTRQAQRIVKQAAERADIKKKVFCHAFRSTFATHLLDAGTDVMTIQQLLGHEDLSTTQIYTKVSTQRIKEVKNPLDSL